MGCVNGCLYGLDKCCLECPMQDRCLLPCDYMDSYEFAVECPDYVKEEEDEQQKKHTEISSIDGI